jgi:hypothetical protein
MDIFGGQWNNSNVKHLNNLNSTNKPIDNGINNNLPEPRPPKRQKKDVLPDVSALSIYNLTTYLHDMLINMSQG